MNHLSNIFAFCVLLFSCACSTITEGRSQQITVNSSPPNAQCLFKQADDIIGRVTTPGTATIRKSKNELVIFCSKAGYESISVKDRSDTAITSYGNLVFYDLSFVANAVDTATGANNKYDSKIFVTLIPAATPGAFVAPAIPLPALHLPAQSLVGMSMQPPMPARALMPAPVVPSAPTRATTVYSNPSIHAALALAAAARKVIAQEQLPQLPYHEMVRESPHRPPFDISQ